MVDKQITGLTYEQLQELLTKVLEAANKPNALEQKALDEDAMKSERRRLLAVELGRAEEEARWRRQNSCTHSRHATSGMSVPKGTGVWTTCGQLHGNDTATLICMRCATPWHFQTTPQEREYINNAGMLGMVPPPIERCLNKNDFVTRPVPREAVAV